MTSDPSPRSETRVEGKHGASNGQALPPPRSSVAELLAPYVVSQNGTEFKKADGRSGRFRRADTLKERKIEWGWHQRIPVAELTLTAGDGGVGKSTLQTELVARVSVGTLGGLPGAKDAPDKPRGAVILSAEEDAEAIILPRLIGMRADLSRIHILAEDVDEDGFATSMTLPSSGGELLAAAEDVDAGIIVVDTGPSFLDPNLRAAREEDVRAFYRPLTRIARKLRAMCLVNCHLNRDSTVSGRGRIAHSAAWQNVPRAGLMMGPTPGQHATDTSERLIAITKPNLIPGVAPPAVVLMLVPSRLRPDLAAIDWTGVREGVGPDDLTRLPKIEEPPDTQAESEACVAILRELEAAGPGGLLTDEMEDARKDAGIAAMPWNAARSKLRKEGAVHLHQPGRTDGGRGRQRAWWSVIPVGGAG